MPTAIGCESSPANSASMAAKDVVKQHADAMPCSDRPSIITANVSLHADSADAIANPTTPMSSTGRGAYPVGDAADQQQRRGERQARDTHDRGRDRGVTPRSQPIVGSSTTTPFMSTESAMTGRLSATAPASA